MRQEEEEEEEEGGKWWGRPHKGEVGPTKGWRGSQAGRGRPSRRRAAPEQPERGEGELCASKTFREYIYIEYIAPVYILTILFIYIISNILDLYARPRGSEAVDSVRM